MTRSPSRGLLSWMRWTECKSVEVRVARMLALVRRRSSRDSEGEAESHLRLEADVANAVAEMVVGMALPAVI